MEHLGELAGLAGTLWGAWETFRRRRAAAREAAAAAARAELERRLVAVSDIAERFAAALREGDLAAMRAIERERKARGL